MVLALQRQQQLGRSLSMNIGFVVGNGISRQSQPLTKLKDIGTVYSCNWASIDVESHHAVIPDRQTLFDILSQHNSHDAEIWTRSRWVDILKHEQTLKPLPDKLYNESHRWDREKHWGSGTHAAWMAAENHDVVVLLGFDLWNSGVNNNVYAGRHGYSHDPVDPGCWIYQLAKTFQLHPLVSFVQIQDTDWQIPQSWKVLDNFSTDTYKNLWQMFD